MGCCLQLLGEGNRTNAMYSVARRAISGAAPRPNTTPESFPLPAGGEWCRRGGYRSGVIARRPWPKSRRRRGDGPGFEIPCSLWLALVRAGLVASLWVARRPFLISRWCLTSVHAVAV
jgi:hypothetical protein